MAVFLRQSVYFPFLSSSDSPKHSFRIIKISLSVSVYCLSLSSQSVYLSSSFVWHTKHMQTSICAHSPSLVHTEIAQSLSNPHYSHTVKWLTSLFTFVNAPTTLPLFLRLSLSLSGTESNSLSPFPPTCHFSAVKTPPLDKTIRPVAGYCKFSTLENEDNNYNKFFSP